MIGTLASYPAYGVDSGDWRHLIASDTGNKRMARSIDAGGEWNGMSDLTDLVEDDQFLFVANVPGLNNALPLVTAISFFPGDPSQVLIGTAEGGIYYSGNRGATWSRLHGSRPATYVTSFFWSSLNTVYVSTFGRGIWRLRNQPIALPEGFDERCGTCDVLSNDGGPNRPPFDNSVLVFDGHILGVRTNERRLREVFVTPGSSVVFTGDPKDLQEDITITESEGKETFEPLPRPPADGWIATGVVFTSDDILTGTAFAESEMSLMPPEKH